MHVSSVREGVKASVGEGVQASVSERMHLRTCECM